jgi:methylated-DNA-[protein]-cysteine S-methyltransferase
MGQRTPLTERVAAQVDEYLTGKRIQFDFPYKLHGTAFQLAVWQALREILYGQTRTYQEIANAIGHPRATRAVGVAIGKNPLQIVVPCHRVIGTNGKLTGYAGGLAMKKALLDLE